LRLVALRAAQLDTVAFAAKLELVVLLSTLLAIVIFRLVTGQIATRGLMARGPGGVVSEERAQLLVATLGAAGYLLISLPKSAPYQMALSSTWLLLLLGGSNGAYLITKYLSGVPRVSDLPLPPLGG